MVLGVVIIHSLDKSNNNKYTSYLTKPGCTDDDKDHDDLAIILETKGMRYSSYSSHQITK